MKPLVIFGTAELGEIAHFYFVNDSYYKIAAFTVDARYLQSTKFCDLPLVAFEEVEKFYPPDKYSLFIAVGFKGLNSVRTRKYSEAREKGYELASYVSSQATVWSGLEVGDNCFILEDNTIQPFVKIGNNLTLWSGNHVGHHAQIGDNCFITSHVVISGGVKIGKNCFVGVNATLRDHITIADNCVIGAGAIIMRDTMENGVYKAESTKLHSTSSADLKL